MVEPGPGRWGDRRGDAARQTLRHPGWRSIGLCGVFRMRSSRPAARNRTISLLITIAAAAAGLIATSGLRTLTGHSPGESLTSVATGLLALALLTIAIKLRRQAEAGRDENDIWNV